MFFSNLLRLVRLLFISRIEWEYFSSTKQNCFIDKHTKINGPNHLSNVTVGYGTYISVNSWISETIIGKFCSIGPNLICGWGIHPLSGISTSPMFYSTARQNGMSLSPTNKIDERKKIVIGNDVFIGANVTILDGVIIGDGAVIGAGALVNKDVPPYAIIGGVPAKIIRFRFSEEKIQNLLKIQWWDFRRENLAKIEQNFFNVDLFIRENISS